MGWSRQYYFFDAFAELVFVAQVAVVNGVGSVGAGVFDGVALIIKEVDIAAITTIKGVSTFTTR